MIILERRKAILQLVRFNMKGLSFDQKLAHIQNWWSIDRNDDEWGALSMHMRRAIEDNVTPSPENIDEYDELLQVAFVSGFCGARNEYIEKVLENRLGLISKIVGEVEQLEVCPCCNFRSLPARSNLDVCPVCFWEDDGICEPDAYSSVNHMTLADGKRNFSLNLTCDPKIAKASDLFLMEKYIRFSGDDSG